MSLPASVTDITPNWLTTYWRRNGYLQQGAVTAVIPGKTMDTTAAFVTPLTIQYTPDGSGTAPKQIVYKQFRPAWDRGAKAELYFYEKIAVEMEDDPAPRYYGGAYAGQTGPSYMLLQNVALTHDTFPWPLPPDRPHQADFTQIIRVLTPLHAHWWGDPRLRAGIFRQPQGGPLRLAHAAAPATIRGYCEQVARDLPAIFDQFDDAVPPAWQAVCEQAVAGWPDLFTARLENEKGITLLHGDFHLWNIWFPKDESTAGLYVLDWETYKPGLATYDLAYLMTLSLPGMRSEWERPLLQQYYDALGAAGIHDYDWEMCLQDYRLSVLASLFPALMWRRIGSLKDAIAAYQDWKCEGLLS